MKSNTSSKNVKLKEHYTQVCVWPATIVGDDKIIEFESFMLDTFGARIQYLEEIKTFPDKDDPNTGDRNDVFFAVHDLDVGKFAIPRLQYGIRWIEDVLDKGNYKNKIYPQRVYKYKSW